jgi:hypothetical protein
MEPHAGQPGSGDPGTSTGGGTSDRLSLKGHIGDALIALSGPAGKRVDVMLALLVELLALSLRLFLCAFGVAQLLSVRTLGFLLGLDGSQVPCGELELKASETVVLGCDGQGDHVAVLCHTVGGLFQPSLCSAQSASPHGLDRVLGFGVVGGEHHLRHLSKKVIAYAMDDNYKTPLISALADARGFLADFVQLYNHEHRHTGIGLHSPADVHYGLAAAMRCHRPLRDPDHRQGDEPGTLQQLDTTQNPSSPRLSLDKPATTGRTSRVTPTGLNHLDKYRLRMYARTMRRMRIEGADEERTA